MITKVKMKINIPATAISGTPAKTTKANFQPYMKAITRAATKPNNDCTSVAIRIPVAFKRKYIII